jgi:hypothetical protein
VESNTKAACQAQAAIQRNQAKPVGKAKRESEANGKEQRIESPTLQPLNLSAEWPLLCH